ncbi:hypothetical protein OXX59_010597, partial [Metschnikowia pulcherrima]
EGAISDISSYTKEHPEATKCGEIVTSRLKTLLKEFREDGAVAPFSDPEIELKPELAAYNSELERFNKVKTVTWLTGPWLYLECYLYQLLNVWFRQTIHLKEFDVF